MRIKFIQTADPIKYARLLEASAPSTRAFCALNGYEYEAFVGVKRGRHPWHATFNRIDLLNEALDADFDGWIVYLDADSFVVDLKFDLAACLKQHSDAPLIARAVVPEKAPTWNINAGVLIFNMKHPQTARPIKTWKRLFDFCCAAGLLQAAAAARARQRSNPAALDVAAQSFPYPRHPLRASGFHQRRAVLVYRAVSARRRGRFRAAHLAHRGARAARVRSRRDRSRALLRRRQPRRYQSRDLAVLREIDLLDLIAAPRDLVGRGGDRRDILLRLAEMRVELSHARA